jgi:hypothetical protein
MSAARHWGPRASPARSRAGRETSAYHAHQPGPKPERRGHRAAGRDEPTPCP